MISILTEAAHALFYMTGGACCGFFLAALCHAAGNDSDDRRLTESLAERERIIKETMETQRQTNDHQRRTRELQDQRQAEITKWAASLAAREGRLARAERLYFERTGHRVDEAAEPRHRAQERPCRRVPPGKPIPATQKAPRQIDCRRQQNRPEKTGRRFLFYR